MPDYPTPSEYQEAVQFPETAFVDEELKEATPETNVLGLPQPITGAFAAVFPMEGRTGRWAVKCFLRNVPDQQRRYRAISRHLEATELPYTVGFDYQPKGITVEGDTYPLLKMAWAEGRALNRFVEAHLGAPDVLEALAEEWAEMLSALEAANVAHGDLQHGNVLVALEDGAPRFRLVDYDTMYVPALKGRRSAEIGHRNYQHPDRNEDDFGPYLDRFPGLVVYVALRAAIAEPVLWERYSTGENLLFRATDFYDPSASLLIEELSEIEAVAPLVEALRTACYLEPESVPELDEVLDGTGAERLTATLPKVLHEGAARRRRSEATPQGMFAKGFLSGVVLVVATAVFLSLLAGWGAALVLLAVGGGLLVGGAAYQYRQQPLVGRRRRLQSEAEHYAELIENLRREIEVLEVQRREVRQTVDERRERRLEELQEKALYDRLKYHFIQEAGAVEGLSHKTVVRLKASDIRTAYEATPERLEPIRQLGEKSKARVAMWRAALVRQYEDEIPEELSPAEERRIARYVEQRVEHLSAEIARMEEKIEVQEKERERVLERKEEMPTLSFGRYLRYLLRVDTLPSPEPTPEPPRATPPPGERKADSSVTPVPQPASEDGPWWGHAD